MMRYTSYKGTHAMIIISNRNLVIDIVILLVGKRGKRTIE